MFFLLLPLTKRFRETARCCFDTRAPLSIQIFKFTERKENRIYCVFFFLLPSVSNRRVPDRTGTTDSSGYSRNYSDAAGKSPSGIGKSGVQHSGPVRFHYPFRALGAIRRICGRGTRNISFPPGCARGNAKQSAPS